MSSTLLIRHAQASFATPDYDRLSALGSLQATLTARYLSVTAGPIARIVCGPLKRQRATAEPIAAAVRNAADCRPELLIDPRLDELQIDACIEQIAPRLPDPGGELRNLLAKAATVSRSYQKVIRRVFPEWQKLDDSAGLESWPAFSARAIAALRDITGLAGRGETTIVVSSGAIIATITQQVLGLPDSACYGLFEAMQNCSITHLKHTGGRISLSSFNETGFLAAMGQLSGAANLLTYR